MRDVATLAQVDTSTVSRALNPATRHKVSADTAGRVLEAAAFLGYRMNSLARGLRLSRTMAVGMVIPDIANPFFPPVVRGAEDELARAGRTLIVMNTDDDPDRETAAIEQLVERQVDAVILATSHLAGQVPASAGRTPCVLVNRESGSRVTPSVVPDDRRGVRLAVRHLAGLGHRRILHVAGPQETSTGLVRRREFESACAALKVGGDVRQAAAFTQEAGLAVARAALAEEPPTAILAANDLMAIGCLRAAVEAGVRVPRDLSVVGYDDMAMADLLHPPLTTVRVPQYRMGLEAARLIVAATDPGGHLAHRRIQVPTSLVVRGSTAPAPVTGSATGAAGALAPLEIPDEVWARIAPVLVASDIAPGRWRDHRQVLAAIAWRTRTGMPWRALPERFGPWQTAWKRFDRWSKDGTLARLRQAAGDDPELAASLDWLSTMPAN